jgi:serine/threonine-protein kinase
VTDPSWIGPGTTIAGYVIEEQVGAGGMAIVFRARDAMLGRVAALKIMSPSIAADPEFRARFVRESRAIAAVEDPHIVPVYAAGEANGVLYIATRFIPGGDLAGLAARSGGLLAPERVTWLLGQVASALDAAHAAGLVHRDVKLANVLVDSVPGRLEHAYLSDFGLTKSTAFTTGLTVAGQFMGTPDYCAPEQVAGGEVDGRADQYALACAAFGLLTGSLPFTRPDPVATLLARLNDPVPAASARRPGLPPAVDAVLARGLARDPRERYPSCGQFAAALRDAVAVPEQRWHPEAPTSPGTVVFFPQPPRRPVPTAGLLAWARRRKRLVIGAAAALALVAAGTGVTLAVLPQPASATLLSTISPANGSGPILGMEFSADGTLVAATDQDLRQGAEVISVWNAGTGKSVATLALPPSYDVITGTAFTGDDKTATAVAMHLNSAGLLEGPVVDYRWDLATGSRSVVYSLGAAQLAPTGTLRPVASGDLSLVAVGGPGGGLDVYHASGVPGALALPPAGPDITNYGFIGDKTIWVADRNGTIYLYDTGSGHQAGQVTPWHSAHGLISLSGAELTPDGTLAEVGSKPAELWNIADKANVTPHDQWWTATTYGFFSWDGHVIVTGTDGNPSGSTSIDVWKIDGTISHLLTIHLPGKLVGQPAGISPDGREVAILAGQPSGSPPKVLVESIGGL